ncbi:hypothetical protein PIB30_080178 [Stylosanthes scabra]|uniref:Uncharacterized protein n=1 Tax=Stylosanthes scabra TaxID=79078 RepID=A0ABU6YNX9_9FABA|nr:hypothetical protein [Stylosanthes scabra]
MVKENISKKGKALSKSSKPRKDGKPKNDISIFNCFFNSVFYFKVLTFGSQKLDCSKVMNLGVYLKRLQGSSANAWIRIQRKEPWWKKWGEVEITTKKIGNALGLSSTGTPFPDKVVPKELSDEDYAVYKFFQGKTQAQLGKLIMDKPVDIVENRRLLMRDFLLFIQKCFLLATSSANVTPRAYPTLYDVENTKQRNWALHVHNFLLEEIKKAKENNTKSVNGYCYAMLIIYFHETQFGKNSRDPIAQPPWIHY